MSPRRITPVARCIALSAAVAYAGTAGTLFAMQRQLLFNTVDTGGLAKPGTLAIAERLFALAPDPKALARMEGSDHATLTRDGLYERHVWPFLEKWRPAG